MIKNNFGEVTMKKTSLVIFISYLFILFSCSDPNKDSESFDNKEQENNA